MCLRLQSPCTPYTAIRSSSKEWTLLYYPVWKNCLFYHIICSLSQICFFLSELQIKRLSLKENVRTILKLITLKRSKDGCIQVKKRRKLIFITLEEFQRVRARANDARRSLKYRSIYRLLSSCHIKFNEGIIKRHQTTTFKITNANI